LPGDIIDAGQPREVAGDEEPARPEQALHFGNRLWFIEIQPALIRGDNVEAGAGERRGFRRRGAKIDVQLLSGSQLPGCLDLFARAVNSRDNRPLPGERSRHHARSRTEIEYGLTG
jgi:hypothetical protein